MESMKGGFSNLNKETAEANHGHSTTTTTTGGGPAATIDSRSNVIEFLNMVNNANSTYCSNSSSINSNCVGISIQRKMDTSGVLCREEDEVVKIVCLDKIAADDEEEEEEEEGLHVEMVTKKTLYYL